MSVFYGKAFHWFIKSASNLLIQTKKGFFGAFYSLKKGEKRKEKREKLLNKINLCLCASSDFVVPFAYLWQSLQLCQSKQLLSIAKTKTNTRTKERRFCIIIILPSHLPLFCFLFSDRHINSPNSQLFRPPLTHSRELLLEREPFVSDGSLPLSQSGLHVKCKR